MQNLQAMLSRLHCSCWGPEGAFLHSCKNSPKLKMVTEKATASVRQVPKCVSKILVRWSRKSEAHAVLTSILLANASIFFLCPGFLFCLFIFFFFLFIYLFIFFLFVWVFCVLFYFGCKLWFLEKKTFLVATTKIHYWSADSWLRACTAFRCFQLYIRRISTTMAVCRSRTTVRQWTPTTCCSRCWGSAFQTQKWALLISLLKVKGRPNEESMQKNSRA